jgi:hypothetical protein
MKINTINLLKDLLEKFLPYKERKSVKIQMFDYRYNEYVDIDTVEFDEETNTILIK